MVRDLVVILAGYLLGSIPFAYLVAKALARKDIRFEGDGNVGARNVRFAVGPRAGLLVLLLDMGKGAAAYWVAYCWASGRIVLYLTAVALFLGHGFPIWLRGRGGKGLSAAIGFLLQMWPWSMFGAALVFLVAGRLIAGFSVPFGIASAAFSLFTLLEGSRPEDLAFIVCFLGLAGIKKAIDRRHERQVQARTGYAEEPPRFRWTG
ncbi:MAG TPA: glycerol-3-phosphate acyltransferase [Anaerolineae bacterium]|nr:glycerol-3-phosphate acyltransferase [Anaerolineae bacterium]HOR01434.1 glycerol-3-phosphate acyltransferase [Anaerolineae bacterium]HPL27153.1 glycerol-3-phosphate acyltransferase [Anaerolineae bacterium]